MNPLRTSHLTFAAISSLFIALACGDDDSPGGAQGGAGGATGGKGSALGGNATATGGRSQATGGKAQSTGGREATGGEENMGGDPNTGGQSNPDGTGGTTATGGRNSETGGTSTGGASTGGKSTGGTSTGGASTGGASTGGTSTGGASTSTGGIENGGAGGDAGGGGETSTGGTNPGTGGTTNPGTGGTTVVGGGGAGGSGGEEQGGAGGGGGSADPECIEIGYGSWFYLPPQTPNRPWAQYYTISTPNLGSAEIDILMLQVFENATGAISLTGEQSLFYECTHCVLLNVEDGSEYGVNFIATSGTLEYGPTTNAMNGKIDVTGTDITLRELDVLTDEIIPGGACVHLDSMTINR